MGVYLFYAILALIPVLWVVGFFMLRHWKYRARYVLVNGLLILLSYVFVWYSGLAYFKNDPYGLRKVFSFLFLLAIHTVIAFIFAVYYKNKLQKNVKE